jgi:hypothetical protein
MLGGGLEVVGLGSVPIDDIPEGGDVVGAAVLVVEIIGVLPDIEADDGFAFNTCDGLAHDGAVLVGGGADGELLVGSDHEPSPAGAEAGGAGLGELFFKFIEAAKHGGDRLGELALGGAAFAWANGFPEERVIGVTATVVANGAANGLGNFGQISDEIAHALRSRDAGVSQGFVHIGDVGLMMLGVVDLHRFGIDVRNKGIISVGKFREFVGHGE